MHTNSVWMLFFLFRSGNGSGSGQFMELYNKNQTRSKKSVTENVLTACSRNTSLFIRRYTGISLILVYAHFKCIEKNVLTKDNPLK